MMIKMDFPPPKDFVKDNIVHTPKIVPNNINSSGPDELSQAEKVLNWQTENAFAQNQLLTTISHKVDQMSENNNRRFNSLQGAISEIQQKLSNLHHEMMAMAKQMKVDTSQFRSKEAEQTNLKYQLKDLQKKSYSPRFLSGYHDPKPKQPVPGFLSSDEAFTSRFGTTSISNFKTKPRRQKNSEFQVNPSKKPSLASSSSHESVQEEKKEDIAMIEFSMSKLLDNLAKTPDDERREFQIQSKEQQSQPIVTVNHISALSDSTSSVDESETEEYLPNQFAIGDESHIPKEEPIYEVASSDEEMGYETKGVPRKQFASKIMVFTFDDIPFEKWNSRLDEFHAWMTSEAITSPTDVVIQQFTSRLSGALKEWWNSLGEYRQQQVYQTTIPLLLGEIHREFVGTPDDYLSQQTKLYIRDLGQTIEEISIGQIQQQVFRTLDKLCKQKEFCYSDYDESSESSSEDEKDDCCFKIAQMPQEKEIQTPHLPEMPQEEELQTSHLPVTIFDPSRREKPVHAIAFIDTGAHTTIMNPKILSRTMWMPHQQDFRVANSGSLSVKLISKPITIELFPGCQVTKEVLGSSVPGKDLILGWDAYSGTKNTLADMLSRKPVKQETPHEIHMMASSSESKKTCYDFEADVPEDVHQLISRNKLHELLRTKIFSYQSTILSSYGVNCHHITPMGIHPDYPFAHLYRIENPNMPEEVLCFLWYLCAVYTVGIAFDIQWLYHYINTVQDKRDCFSTFLRWFSPLSVWSGKLRKSAKATNLTFKKLKRGGLNPFFNPHSIYFFHRPVKVNRKTSKILALPTLIHHGDFSRGVRPDFNLQDNEAYENFQTHAFHLNNSRQTFPIPFKPNWVHYPVDYQMQLDEDLQFYMMKFDKGIPNSSKEETTSQAISQDYCVDLFKDAQSPDDEVNVEDIEEKFKFCINVQPGEEARMLEGSYECPDDHYGCCEEHMLEFEMDH
ncbi:unnamed protein product [Arabidopsis arenosa]|uniref:Uncharacterized protein n=1 Tax=Arabidopsis arenosa TaxID=38785 RepID=A0A8S2AWE9_ARAAE|nr:unnamed protein product [Arabidopsis arenosa]